MKIYFEADSLTSADFSLTVDNKPIESTVVDDSIVFGEGSFGFHMLRLTSTKKIKFKKVIIGETNIRDLIYLGYVEDATGIKHQPGTELWGTDTLTWVLPFANPASRWVDQVSQKINRGFLSKNIFDSFHLFYPESVDLTGTDFPEIIQDFYKYNFDFTAIPKNNPDLTEVPYLKYNKEIPADIITDICAEIDNNFDYFKSELSVLSKTRDDFADFNKTNENSWKLLWLVNPDVDTEANNTLLPSVQRLLEFLDIDVYYAFMGLLPPGAFIYPHADDYEQNNNKYKGFEGCTQLYIPIKWPRGCSVKMANAGIVPIGQGTVAINNDYVVHAVINNSIEYRYVIGIRTTQDAIVKNCGFF
jgi:hypothetical protein